MKILQCHNFYQKPGGEDQCFRDEAQLLREHGHEVVQYTMHNDAVKSMGRFGLLAKTFWNRESYREVRQLIRRERPDIMHCTNTFPLMSPSVYAAARVEGVAVVQALHNYRLLCPNAYFLRDGRPCEDCLGKLLAWPSIRHACYRDSRAATGVVATMLAVHRLLGTWRNSVDMYYTVSHFARGKFLEAGFPADKVMVKPNAVFRDPGVGDGVGEYAVFLGRLQPEKGIPTLLEAWSRLPEKIPLKIVGDGPLAADVRRAAERDPRIQWLGWQNREQVDAVLQNAAFLVMPSILYETFGLAIVEAYAAGRPVVASRLGAMAELVEHGRTGQLFTAGDADALAAAATVQWGTRRDCQTMRDAARSEYEIKYTAQASYDGLLNVYARALAARGKTVANTSHYPLTRRGYAMIDHGQHNILGIRINAVDYEAAVEKVVAAANSRSPFAVSALAVHGVMTGVLDSSHRYRLNAFDLIVPDGQPVRWALGWLHGKRLADRVYGPTLTLKLCERAAADRIPIFLYGSTTETLTALQKNLVSRFPGLQISGAKPSRFRRLTATERDEVVAEIQASGAKITFVGLGCPRQEVWTYEFRELLHMPVVAVGAAFAFHAGLLPQAPPAMQRWGLEWLFRLVQEPVRLWKRYLFLNPLYLMLLALQYSGIYTIKPEQGHEPNEMMLYG